jgi:hypothetical protein
MFRMRTILRSAATAIIAGVLTLSVARADSLTVVNPDFSAVPVQCSGGYAYQSTIGGNCEGSNSLGPEQNFDAAPGIGWIFAPHPPLNATNYGDGITGPNTLFDPPQFTELPFGYAAFLQSRGGTIAQKIDGFVPGQVYVLRFYLGSRYAEGCCGGNQMVLATLDGNAIGLWKLVSFTPFSPRTAVFKVATGGSHVLAFTGLATLDNTAFFSGVSIETVNK